MHRLGIVVAVAVTFGLWVATFPVESQTIPKLLQEGGPEDVIRQRENTWTVGVAGGNMDGTYLRFADEIGKVLDDGPDLRVLPIISRGAAANLEDLLYLRGVDIAFTQADVFEYFRTQRKTPNLESRINYIIRLPIAELHVTARADIHTLEELRGKKVVFGPPGSSPTLTGPIVFQRLGIAVEPIFVDFSTGMKMLRTGEVSGLLGVVSKPVDFWTKMPADLGLHLLPVPFSKTFADFYTVGEFTHEDYPNLIPEGQIIDTLAVPSVLAVYNWPKTSDRYRRVERFTQYLFARWDKLAQPPFHPRWRDVNLAATIPGWTRNPIAEDILQRLAQARGTAVREVRAPFTEAERNALFREFQQWNGRQRKQ